MDLSMAMLVLTRWYEFRMFLLSCGDSIHPQKDPLPNSWGFSSPAISDHRDPDDPEKLWASKGFFKLPTVVKRHES